jgi:hypothetical protein
MYWSDPRHRSVSGLTPWLVSFGLLLLPAALLGWLAARFQAFPLAVGAGVQVLFVLVFLRAHPVWRPPAGPSVVVLYLMALAWAWVPTRGASDWAVDLVQGALIITAVGLIAVIDLNRTGAEPLRRANKWSRRIAGRRDWPVQLSDCRIAHEAVALRAAIRDDPGPALALLSDPHPQVQAAALGALEYRPNWRPGEAELVLRTAQRSEEPAVRAAAAYAMAGVDTPELVAGLADLLRDPAVEVRHAAAEAILWDGDHRWPMARDAVKDALADARLASDGPLFAGCAGLPAAAVCDLTAWAAEPPPLGSRAVLTLAEQYRRALADADRPELGYELSTQMLDPDTPPGLRVEVAALLRDHDLLTPDLLDRLTNPDQPGPIRLFAAEVMLRQNPTDPDGLDVLRGLARQPNREMSMAVAGILQGVLGLDLGLSGGELPAPNTKGAADLVRRVLAWANGAGADVLRPTPGGGIPGLKPASQAGMPGLKSTSSHRGRPGLPPDPRQGSRGVF